MLSGPKQSHVLGLGKAALLVPCSTAFADGDARRYFIVGTISMNLIWRKFDNFFQLYEKLLNEPRLFYVIGESRHCYIGSVGGRRGEGGLAVRYQQQYVDRAKAIFGSESPINQPAFASIVTDQQITVDDIEPIERQIQEVFLQSYGRENALFTPRGKVQNYELIHEGDMPQFLRKVRT